MKTLNRTVFASLLVVLLSGCRQSPPEFTAPIVKAFASGDLEQTKKLGDNLTQRENASYELHLLLLCSEYLSGGDYTNISKQAKSLEKCPESIMPWVNQLATQFPNSPHSLFAKATILERFGSSNGASETYDKAANLAEALHPSKKTPSQFGDYFEEHEITRSIKKAKDFLPLPGSLSFNAELRSISIDNSQKTYLKTAIASAEFSCQVGMLSIGNSENVAAVIVSGDYLISPQEEMDDLSKSDTDVYTRFGKRVNKGFRFTSADPWGKHVLLKVSENGCVVIPDSFQSQAKMRFLQSN